MRTSTFPAFLALLGALGVLAPAPPGSAADHSDGRIGLDVLTGLAEGPPYAAAPVEIGAELRHPGSVPSPAGEIHLTLVNSEDESAGDPIPLTGTAFDNGDPFGETGDTVSMDVYFVPGAPPDDELPMASLQVWAQRPDPGESPSSVMEFTNAEPAVIELELFFDDYETQVSAVSTGEFLGSARMRTRFEVAAGQDLQFENVSVTGPDASGELRYSARLRRVPGGSFDPAEPLYRITIANEPIQLLPGLPAVGRSLVLGALLLGGVWASRSASGSVPLARRGSSGLLCALRSCEADQDLRGRCLPALHE